MDMQVNLWTYIRQGLGYTRCLSNMKGVCPNVQYSSSMQQTVSQRTKPPTNERQFKNKALLNKNVYIYKQNQIRKYCITQQCKFNFVVLLNLVIGGFPIKLSMILLNTLLIEVEVNILTERCNRRFGCKSISFDCLYNSVVGFWVNGCNNVDLSFRRKHAKILSGLS